MSQPWEQMKDPTDRLGPSGMKRLVSRWADPEVFTTDIYSSFSLTQGEQNWCRKYLSVRPRSGPSSPRTVTQHIRRAAGR